MRGAWCAPLLLVCRPISPPLPPPPPASLSYYVSSLSLSLTMCPLSGAYLRQPAVPSGKIGKLRIHQSGKVTMLIGDIECVSSLTALCLCAPCSVSLCPPSLLASLLPFALLLLGLLLGRKKRWGVTRCEIWRPRAVAGAPVELWWPKLPCRNNIMSQTRQQWDCPKTHDHWNRLVAHLGSQGCPAPISHAVDSSLEKSAQA